MHGIVLLKSPDGSAKLIWMGGGAQRFVLRGCEYKQTGSHSAAVNDYYLNIQMEMCIHYNL
jgi:hypothetical protein